MTTKNNEEMRKVYYCVSRWSDELNLEAKSNDLELHTYNGSMSEILLTQILGKDHPIIIVHNGTLHIESGATVHNLLYVADSLN